MDNKKFTDEEIIKALELCTQQNGSIPCYDCPCWNNDEQKCDGIDYTVTFDLILKQKAEIKKLKRELKGLQMPCKVGDTVWYITGITHNFIKSARVEEIIINETGVRELYVSTENYCYFQKDINTFYLTREAAEKALEEKK